MQSHLEDPKTVEACDKRLKDLTKERSQADGDDVRVEFLTALIDSTLEARTNLARAAALVAAA